MIAAGGQRDVADLVPLTATGIHTRIGDTYLVGLADPGDAQRAAKIRANVRNSTVAPDWNLFAARDRHDGVAAIERRSSLLQREQIGLATDLHQHEQRPIGCGTQNEWLTPTLRGVFAHEPT